jgi:hypothetical protein
MQQWVNGKCLCVLASLGDSFIPENHIGKRHRNLRTQKNTMAPNDTPHFFLPVGTEGSLTTKKAAGGLFSICDGF